MLNIEVNVSKELSAKLARLTSVLNGPEMRELNEVGGRSARNAAETWQRDFGKNGGWRGKRYIKGTIGRPGSFGHDVADGWMFRASDENGATIANNANHYAFKVSGGTITAKRVSMLTIPLIPEAKGRRAADYAIDFRTRLFRPKGKNALMEKTADGGVRSVYALVKSVTMPPMPEAVPPEHIIAEAFSIGWRRAFLDKMETS